MLKDLLRHKYCDSIQRSMQTYILSLKNENSKLNLGIHNAEQRAGTLFMKNAALTVVQVKDTQLTKTKDKNIKKLNRKLFVWKFIACVATGAAIGKAAEFY